MKNQYVDALQEGDVVNDIFVATRNDLRTKQDGGKFLGMVFKDRTGEVGGIMWNNAAEASRRFEVGDVVNVRGRVSVYQNRNQIVVDQVVPLRDGDYDIGDLVHTPEVAGEALEGLQGFLATIKDPHLKALVDAFLDDEVFMTQFAAAAAAKKWHHEYRGGLAQHCFEMCTLAETMCGLYPDLNRDLLFAGVLLHDLGKLYEMTHDLHVEYTNAGKLVGHLQIGADMANAKIRDIDGFPESLRLQLVHLILSHHGEMEFGSPVVPKTLEAIVLHHIDNLDAQAAAFTRIIREARQRGQKWSDFQPLIERVIWTGDE